MAEYGMKATVTAVAHDDDKYEVGFTYSDSDGRAIDKSFDGSMATIDDDITKALLEVYAEHFMNKQKKADKENENENENDVKPSKEESRFAELEEENKRLNRRIAEMMSEQYRHFKNGEYERVGDNDTVAGGNRRFHQYTSNRTWSWSDMRDLHDFLFDIMK